MPDFAQPIERLIDQLKHLPGIGAKTAQRLAFHILRMEPEAAMALASAIQEAKTNMRFCSVCNSFMIDIMPLTSLPSCPSSVLRCTVRL